MPEFTPTAILASTGQSVRLVIQTTNNSGARVDGYTPTVTQVLFPDLTSAGGYPTSMDRLDTGLYVHGLEIPQGADALGTFIVSVFFLHPNSGDPVWEIFTVQVSRPFGNTSVSPA